MIIDPIAQTFFVDIGTYPNGMYAHSVDLCFSKKDELTFMPFTLQLRPTVNGYPHNFIIYPFSEVVVTPDKINVTETPDLSNSANYTRFVFDAPVYLQPGEHSMILFSNSDQYTVYIAEMGKFYYDGSGRLISKQPYSGSFFKSQNGSTYTAYQDKDLMFRLNRCSFTLGQTNLVLKNETPSSKVLGDTINFSSTDLILKGGNIDYSYRGTSNATSTLSGYVSVVKDKNINLSERIKVENSGNTLYAKAVITVEDSAVSPTIDTERAHMIVVENVINDGQLSSENFTITNTGTGYTANASVTITSTYGSGANAYAVANTTTKTIESIIVDTQGLGYYGTVTATIAAPSVPSGNTTATAKVADEEDPSGGNCTAKYITRRVALNDGFEAGTLRVYFDAINLIENEILVYYKVLAAEDPDLFDNRPYVLMNNVQKGNESLPNLEKSRNGSNYLEYLYVPTNDSCSYIGNINSVNYNKFKYFAIKIVMLSSDSTKVPKVRNLRIIALDE